ncbi:CAP domain containing protein [Trichuris trichiura]|uniref:CAP domain containing protein n=1 Tax=Trichuris trichiura TaxID=36087 RepID=A0A077Z4L3_TRITR|nr:CAP domain containing protein [Trichuris trichiura]
MYKLIIAHVFIVLAPTILGFSFDAPAVTDRPGFLKVSRPFSDDEQMVMLAHHNLARGNMTNQVNMQCLSDVNEDLVNYAQDVADTCIHMTPRGCPYGLGFFRIQGVRTGYLDYVMRPFEFGLLHYNYLGNHCNRAEYCDLFRQVFWYKADEIGCGRTTCGTQTFIVCAYTHKQNPNAVPFIQYPEKGQCLFCQKKKSSCDYNYLCCDPH